MKTEFLLLTLYESNILTFEQICETLGISRKRGYNLRSEGKFPIPLLENPLRADVRDVAEYLDEIREKVKKK